MVSAAAPTATDGRLDRSTRVFYGLGSLAFGVKDNGFSYFLLIFYSQVIGLDARLVGLALTISLLVDAFFDPILGYWSDNLRSKWGRRHPFMYVYGLSLKRHLLYSTTWLAAFSKV